MSTDKLAAAQVSSYCVCLPFFSPLLALIIHLFGNTCISLMPRVSFALLQAFVNKVNEDYSKKHFEFEKQFWGTKMALKSTDETPYSTDLLSSTKKEMEDMLADPKILEDAKAHREAIGDDAPSDLVKTLDIIIKTCGCYTMPTAGAKAIREETSKVEGTLEKNRNEMKLGYTDPADSSTFHEMSSVGLRNLLRTAPEESTRKAAYEGLRSIGSFVVENGFVEIVKLRNKLGETCDGHRRSALPKTLICTLCPYN